MLRPLLFALLLQLKVHFKMKVISWIVTQFFLCYGSSAGKSVCTAPHPGKKRGGINIKTNFLQGKRPTV